MATPQVQSVVKAFKILSHFNTGESDLSLKALAELSNMSVSTTHRFLRTLTSVGAVKVDAQGNYSISSAIEQLGSSNGDTVSWRGAVNRVVQELSHELNATAHLCVANDDMVRCVVKAGTSRGLKLETYVGIEFDCYFSSAGKVILAHLPVSQLAEYLGRGGFVKMTPNTIVDPQALAKELRDVRKNGFAVDRAEFVEDVFCLAVPVRYNGRVFGGLSSSFSRQQWEDVDVQEMSLTLQKRVAQIEQILEEQPARRELLWT